jgi:prophage regulatory protein
MAEKIQTRLSILRRNQVEERTGLSRSTIYLRIKEGTFPRPINIGSRAVGWLENEIDGWLATCVENRDSRNEIP